MESDGSKVIAKKTYGGPLLLRTVFGDIETTYQYLYNAHGDVVTLLSDGAMVATYYYDSFGNVLEQTGDVDNSILYAGYQYDEESGLYYINARMYDPITARFLQADTYLGSLNLYTYCLNNPHKYTDPSGHFVITAVAVLLAARVVTLLVSGVMSAKAEYDRQVAEGDNYADWASILFVGGANAGLSFATFGIGSGAVKGAGVGAKLLFKHLGKAVVRDAAIGALMDAGIETARQLVTGTGITNLEYDRITEAGVMGGIIGGGSTLAGAALEGLAKTRVVKSAVAKVTQVAGKGKIALESGFAKIAGKNGKSSVREMTGLGESRFKLNLQFFASDEVYRSGNKSNLIDIRGYRHLEEPSVLGIYEADLRLIVEMPYNGKNTNTSNAQGWLRDNIYYWKEILERHPDAFSSSNRDIILGKNPFTSTPINDKTFRQYFPQYDVEGLRGKPLIHHHIGGGGQAFGLPSSLHIGSGGIHNAEKMYGIWGVDSDYAERLQIFLK